MNFSYLLMRLFFQSIHYFCEIVCSSIKQKKLVNRGFLCGPYCPIYGVGSLFILLLLLRFKDNPVVIYILGAILTSAIEYITSFLLEKIFHNKWWDYSDEKFNIHGRVYLFNTLLFGFGTLIIIYTGNDLINYLLGLLPEFAMNILAYSLLVIFIIDVIYSSIVAYNLRNRLIICEELKNEKLAKIPGMIDKEVKKRIEKLRAYPKRLLEAFPNLQITNAKELDLLKKIKAKKKTSKRAKKRK